MIPGFSIDHRLIALGWLVLYAGLYALAAMITWHFREVRGRDEKPLVTRLRSWPHWRLLGRALWLVGSVGVPYSALLSGVVSPLDMGLIQLDWLPGIARGAAWGVGSFFLLAFSWWTYGRAISGSSAEVSVSLIGHRRLAHAMTFALADECRWTFYRGIIVPWIGQYYGAYAALLLALGLPCLSPWIRARLRRVGSRELLLFRASLAVVSTTAFVLTGNFWICLALHVLLDISLSYLIPIVVQR